MPRSAPCLMKSWTSFARPSSCVEPASPMASAHTIDDLPLPLGPMTTFNRGPGRTCADQKAQPASGYPVGEQATQAQNMRKTGAKTGTRTGNNRRKTGAKRAQNRHLYVVV